MINEILCIDRNDLKSVCEFPFEKLDFQCNFLVTFCAKSTTSFSAALTVTQSDFILSVLDVNCRVPKIPSV